MNAIAPNLGRVDVPTEVRQAATALQGKVLTVSGALGRMWSTPESVARAELLLVEIAEEALALRRKLR